MNAPFYTGIRTADDLTKSIQQRLDRAQHCLTQIEEHTGPHTTDGTLKLYDEILLHLDAAGSQSSLLENVHPDGAVRTSAEELSQKVSALGSAMSLNRKLYDALAAVDISAADAATKHFVTKTLRDFRLSGVDKDESTRARITAIREELVLISQEFSRNIREDKRSVTVADAKELAGLPQDFIDRHTPDENGQIVLTTEYPDAVPVLTYAASESLRKRMYMEFNNRAYPKNMEVLDRLIAKRYELAQLLGFENFAACVTADKMVGSERQAAEFIDRMADASLVRSQADYRQLLARKQKDVPDAERIEPWEAGYYSELLKRTEYQFDAQQIRPYLPYPSVKQGVLNAMSTLFGVEFRRNTSVAVWHESVECYEMFEHGTLTGRFYLDMHPRADKYSHAAQFGICNGVAGVQIPEAALVCNFPGGVEGDPGLMEHNDVETFFHEFGHLLHHLFAGRQKWMGLSGISCEWDFVEVPSQLLEEWAWDVSVLQTFAHHYQTGERVPASLVAQMKRADEFGKGLFVRQQMFYAKLSLSCYDRHPSTVDTTALSKELREKYTPYTYVEGTHFQTSFGHLDGYSAIYYTYMWSLVIAKDFFTLFDRKNMMDAAIATRYRDVVLARGGAEPAHNMVKEFLGREFNYEGWREWLER
ncbi:MAG: Zn-dependent oligopeptidase [Bacteroidetes bacterium]|nr:Zn-dependent oligopeptidase [Bacteroidota bacterium]